MWCEEAEVVVVRRDSKKFYKLCKNPLAALSPRPLAPGGNKSHILNYNEGFKANDGFIKPKASVSV